MLSKIDKRLRLGDKSSAIALFPIDIAAIMGHDVVVVDELQKQKTIPRSSPSFFNNPSQIALAAMSTTQDDKPALH